MKKLLIAGLAILTVPAGVLAQNEKTKVKDSKESKDFQQIIITRTGDKDEKTVIEIQGDKVKVNGKEVNDDKDVKVGQPVVSGVKVSAEVVEQDIQADKVTSIRYKAKKRVHKVHGHRQRQQRHVGQRELLARDVNWMAGSPPPVPISAEVKIRYKAHPIPATVTPLPDGAFFVIEPQVFDYIDGDTTQWEREPLERLAREGQLMAYRHDSFWQCMDTLRDRKLLEQLWQSGHAPWKTW